MQSYTLYLVRHAITEGNLRPGVWGRSEQKISQSERNPH
jgi:broad specificity phosphatase PhoE